jgi:hypothetical protein
MIYLLLFTVGFLMVWGFLMFKGPRFLLLPLWARLSLGLGVWAVLVGLALLARIKNGGG